MAETTTSCGKLATHAALLLPVVSTKRSDARASERVEALSLTCSARRC
jgi:hypothetical protein